MKPRPETTLELVEIELKRIRAMAAQADDAALVYMIEMAIMEAKKARASLRPEPSESPPRT